MDLFHIGIFDHFHLEGEFKIFLIIFGIGIETLLAKMIQNIASKFEWKLSWLHLVGPIFIENASLSPPQENSTGDHS